MAAPDSSRSISPGWPSPPSTTALVMALLGNRIDRRHKPAMLPMTGFLHLCLVGPGV
ncbi:Uncharacterised protein [Bordetella pertussis]|nr:Uncharacterised protein [Bordetella pertussis]